MERVPIMSANIQISTIPHKIFETFLCFSIVSFHCKCYGARFLLQEVVSASSLTNLANDLRLMT